MLCWLLQIPLGFPDSSVGKEYACNAGDPDLIPGSGRSPGEGIGYPLQYSWASLVAQLVKNPPAMRETWVQSLGWEDPLEKGKRTHSSILAWRIPWTVESMRLQSWTRLSDFLFHFLSRSHQQRAVLGGLGRNPQCGESWHEAPRTSLSFHIDWEVSTMDESGTSVMSLD